MVGGRSDGEDAYVGLWVIRNDGMSRGRGTAMASIEKKPL